ncbi:putative signal peptide protein [Puccinia sorghi]|uniref:Putative signal peptide protein n=1 Tax=Puccinia sorghi TaxID=27349 RepID=A0A0L6U992_9BASI|nr:putative signal peptide protein [Puccinia sorghi]
MYASSIFVAMTIAFSQVSASGVGMNTIAPRNDYSNNGGGAPASGPPGAPSPADAADDLPGTPADASPADAADAPSATPAGPVPTPGAPAPGGAVAPPPGAPAPGGPPAPLVPGDMSSGKCMCPAPPACGAAPPPPAPNGTASDPTSQLPDPTVSPVPLPSGIPPPPANGTDDSSAASFVAPGAATGLLATLIALIL